MLNNWFGKGVFLKYNANVSENSVITLNLHMTMYYS